MAVDSIAYDPALSSAAVAEGREGQLHRGGQTLWPRGLTDNTPITRTANQVRQEELLHERVWKLMPLACEQVSGSALAVAVNKGQYRKGDGTLVEFGGNATYTVPDATTGVLIWIDVATNTLDDGVAWPVDLTTFVPIAELDTAAGAIVEGSIKDRTTLVKNWIPASSTSATGTTATAFTIDDDNAGAGADQQVRFNRGSTDGEDAAVEWDETNDRINLYTQHTTKTLAPVNVAGVKIAGTDALTSDGAAKVAAAVAGDGLTHAAGVLAVNADGTSIEVIADAVSIKTGGILTTHLGNTLADLLGVVSIPNSSGASPRTVAIQVQDVQGDALAETVYLLLGVYQDADGAATATNATIAVGATGTLIRSVTAGKELIVKTNASGQVTLTVTDGTPETVHLLAAATVRSKLLDCADVGTVVIA